ncbi:hypothetical protein EMCRGX_G003052 [Ephydatia muelleri]
MGRCTLQLAAETISQLEFEVLDTKHHSLLSLDTCLKLGLLKYNTEEVCIVHSDQELTHSRICEEYLDLFSGIGCLPGEYDIELDSAIPPVQNRPRKVPHMMKAAVEEKISSLVQCGVLAPVKCPTEWISNLTAVWKADKKQVRVCLDHRDLNRAVRRNHFNMPTLDDVLPKLKDAKIFSLLDAKDGFLHVKLTERTPEEFQRRLQAALQGLDGVEVVADDVLVYGSGTTEKEATISHDERLVKLLQRAREVRLKFNKDKLRLYLTELVYIGHHISVNGLSPDPAKVTAVKNMPEPTSPQAMRHFLGMCNYLAWFIHRLSATSEPLRRLTEGNAEFRWTEAEKLAFRNLKDMISQKQLLTFYDVRKPVVIQYDASTEGLGATLLQEGRPVVSISRSLTKSERNYVALELECLAVVFACQKFDQYIYGKRVTVETDHKPLEVIIKKSLLAAPRRLQRMLLQLQWYDLNVVYVPGSQQVVADTQSRAPVEAAPEDTACRDDVFHLGLKDAVFKELQVISERDFIPISDMRLTAVKEAAKGGQVVVPSSLREEFLRRLHSSHPGQESTCCRARDVVYWPGMLEDIKQVTTTCPVSEENMPAQAKQDIRAHEIPEQPWAKGGLDLFRSKGKDNLIIVDYLTDFLEICPLSQTLKSDVIGATKEQFARHGIPVVVQSDGGPQFMACEFQVFASTWGQERLKPEIQEEMWERKIRKQQTRQRPAKVQLEPIQVGQPVLAFKENPMEQGKKEQSVSKASSHQPYVDEEDRMSDQGPTQGLPVPNVGKPALEVTTLPREATTVEREVSTPVNGDQLQEGSSVNQHPPAAVENSPLTVTPVVGKDRVQTRSGRVVREPTRFKDFVKHT